MKSPDAEAWTIGELSERVAAALGGGGYDGVSSGRVRDVPDARTIRYYTTLGLLDRPLAFRGRVALYGLRHLQRIVAIKRLQAAGSSLAEVQRRLLGIGAAELARLAEVDPARLARSDHGGEETADREPIEQASEPASRAAGPFWRARPAARREPEEPPALGLRAAASKADPEARAVPFEAIRLGETGEAVLLVAAGRPLDVQALQAIRRASAPLLQTLRELHLLEATRRETDSKDQPRSHTPEPEVEPTP